MSTLRYRDPNTGVWTALSGAAYLDDLTDVDTVTAPAADGTALAWDSTVSQWTPQPVWGSWTGSQSEFDAITTKLPHVLYVVI